MSEPFELVSFDTATAAQWNCSYWEVVMNSTKPRNSSFAVACVALEASVLDWMGFGSEVCVCVCLRMKRYCRKRYDYVSQRSYDLSYTVCLLGVNAMGGTLRCESFFNIPLWVCMSVQKLFYRNIIHTLCAMKRRHMSLHMWTSAQYRELTSEMRQRFVPIQGDVPGLNPALTASYLHVISQWIPAVILAHCLAVLQCFVLPQAVPHGKNTLPQRCSEALYISVYRKTMWEIKVE